MGRWRSVFRGVYNHLFCVADVKASGATLNGELHVAFDRTDFLAVFPLKDERRVRLIGAVREESAQQQDILSWNDVSPVIHCWRATLRVIPLDLAPT